MSADNLNGPISPDDVYKVEQPFPPEVFTAFNQLIARNFNGRSATVYQEEVIGLITSSLNISRSEVFDNHYLDVENAYIGAGWEVTYDKPAFNESYPAKFEFKKK